MSLERARKTTNSELESCTSVSYCLWKFTLDPALPPSVKKTKIQLSFVKDLIDYSMT